MNRRTFLASLPTLLLAGCATRLGLVDRVEVTEKYVQAVEHSDGEQRESELARRRYRVEEGEPEYVGEIDDVIVADLEDGAPLVIPETTGEDLERAFLEVRYGIEACENSDGERRDCRDVRLFLDDFNEIEVGDVVDLRLSDDGAGLVSVHRRRDERA